MTSPISFFIPGIPKTAGSKRAFMPKGWKRPIIVDDCEASKDWRGDVKRFALEAFRGNELIAGEVYLALTFVMPRPKAHFKPDGDLREKAPLYHTSKPDLLKMARAVEDALTGIIWRDDSQIACEHLMKQYGWKPGCHVEIQPPNVEAERPAGRKHCDSQEPTKEQNANDL